MPLWYLFAEIGIATACALGEYLMAAGIVLIAARLCSNPPLVLRARRRRRLMMEKNNATNTPTNSKSPRSAHAGQLISTCSNDFQQMPPIGKTRGAIDTARVTREFGSEGKGRRGGNEVYFFDERVGMLESTCQDERSRLLVQVCGIQFRTAAGTRFCHLLYF